MAMNDEQLKEWATAKHYEREAVREPDSSKWLPPLWDRRGIFVRNDDATYTHLLVDGKGKVWRTFNGRIPAYVPGARVRFIPEGFTMAEWYGESYV